jgi:hypothetical protein
MTFGHIPAQSLPHLDRTMSIHRIIGLLLLLTTTGFSILAQRLDIETQAAGGFMVVTACTMTSEDDAIFVGRASVFRINNGNVLWSKVLLDTTVYYNEAHFHAVALASNGDIIVAGEESRFGLHYGFIARLDQDGVLLWSTSVRPGMEATRFMSVLQAADGSLYVSGDTGTSGQWNECVARFASTGELLWFRDIDYPDSQHGRDAILEGDTLVVLGSTILGSGVGDMALFRYAPDGTLLTFRTLGTGDNEWPTTLLADGMGGYVVSYHSGIDRIGVLRLGPTFQPVGSPRILSSGYDLGCVGALWNTATQSCTMAGMAANSTDYFGMSVQVSLADNTVTWERSYPGTSFALAISSNPSLISSLIMCNPNGFNGNGSYPLHLFSVNLSTGTDMGGNPCDPSPALNVVVTQGSIAVMDHTVTNRIHVPEVTHGITVQDRPLMTSSCPQTPLPVEWLDWEVLAAEDGILLSWSTGSEWNNDHYAIERSFDGGSWHGIGVVPSAGNSAARVDYTWTDREPIQGTTYYRLRQVDQDGAYSFSTVHSVEWAIDHDAALFLPNPTMPGQPVHAFESVVLFDLVGKQLSGPVDHFLAPDRPGVYLVRGKSRCERLVVQ